MPDPFVSSADLVDYLGRGGTADPGFVIAADAACDIVRTMSEQTFNRSVRTFVFDGTGTDALLIPETPVNSAGTVTVNGSAVTDYVLRSDGILLRGTAGCDPRPVWPSGRQNVVVTADCGYDDQDIPRDIRMVALMIASRLAVQGPLLEESIGTVRAKYAVAATDFTAGEKAILRKYRRT